MLCVSLDMNKSVPQKKLQTRKTKRFVLGKEVRELLPNLGNEDWDRIETDISFREGFALGIQIVRMEYNNLLNRIL